MEGCSIDIHNKINCHNVLFVSNCRSKWLCLLICAACAIWRWTSISVGFTSFKALCRIRAICFNTACGASLKVVCWIIESQKENELAILIFFIFYHFCYKNPFKTTKFEGICFFLGYLGNVWQFPCNIGLVLA